MGELALVGDHSTVPLTRVSCNTGFFKSQNARKAGTLFLGMYFDAGLVFVKKISLLFRLAVAILCNGIMG